MSRAVTLLALAAVIGLACATYPKGKSHGGGHIGRPGNLFHLVGKWAAWGQWSQCSETCGHGTRSRTRQCVAKYGPHYFTHHSYKPAYKCPGSDTESEECIVKPCPVDGGWTSWSSFGDCSKTCGGGEKTRYRTCTNPAPANGGKDCVGPSSDSMSCNEQGCPVNGGWSDWTPFGDCSKSCGDGIKTRHRTCTNPTPKNGGDDCTGPSSDKMSCNERGCLGWTRWSSWSACRGRCGSGIRIRTRTCSRPYDYRYCQGPSSQTKYCHHNAPCFGKY